MDNTATPQLDASRLKLAEHERNVHLITVEEGVTRAQIINPAFLAHIAAKLRPYDQIEVRCDDGTIWARTLVLQAERTWARIYVLEWHDLTTRDVSLSQAAGEGQEPGKVEAPDAKRDAEFQVVYKGPHKKWCVIRNLDSQYVREGEENKAQAVQWLDQWIKVTS